MSSQLPLPLPFPLIAGHLPLTLSIGSWTQKAKLASPRSSHQQVKQPTLWQRAASFLPGTEQYSAWAKLSANSRIPVIYLTSGLLLFLILLAQFFWSRDIKPPSPRSPSLTRIHLSPFGDSVYRQEAYYEQLEPGTQCKPRSLFSADLPVTHALTNMALEAEAKRVAAQFEYSSEDVNKGVKEFIHEMEEGLQKQGTPLSQIPTYVTSVPNGTEKVGCQDIS